MLIHILDTIQDEIMDYFTSEDIDNLFILAPSPIRMYKATFLAACLTFPRNFLVECTFCKFLKRVKFRRGAYICQDCLTRMISIPIFSETISIKR